MSASTATAIVRDLVAHLTGDAPRRAAFTGLRTPLGESITAMVSERPASSPGHLEARLTLAEMHRGDDDSDLAVVVEPSGAIGVDHDAPEAWNVHMTLPTLLRILGADPTTEGTPE